MRALGALGAVIGVVAAQTIPAWLGAVIRIALHGFRAVIHIRYGFMDGSL